MTTWKPDFDPTTEIHRNLFTNASGYGSHVTGFREIISAVPVALGSAYTAVQVTGFTVIHSGNTVDVYVQGSGGGMALATSANYDLIVRGIQ